MSRDGRGTPGRVALKTSAPKLKLADLLRRRRTTLTAFVNELGVTTHAGLAHWCVRMGVLPPSYEDFIAIFPPAERVNSAQEGVVVLNAPAVIDEATGYDIDPEAPVFQGVEVKVVTDVSVPIITEDYDVDVNVLLAVSGSLSNEQQIEVVVPDEPTEGTQKKTRKKKDYSSTET